MPLRALFHPAARVEFRAAVARYESERSGLGTLFADRVREVVARSAEAPLTGAPYALPDVRRLFVFRFPYSVVYLVEPGRVLIVAAAQPHFMKAATAQPNVRRCRWRAIDGGRSAAALLKRPQHNLTLRM